MRKISAPSAPSALSVAISPRLRSRKAPMAWAAPTPPTARAVNPTSVRNIVTCSTNRFSPGAASRRSRICQPASAKRAVAARLNAAMVLSGASATR